MKRNEFKLLIENWRKNFIVESSGKSEVGPEDAAFFMDDMHDEDIDTLDADTSDFSDLSPEDMDLARGIDHYPVERQPHPDGSSAIYYPGETDSRSDDVDIDQSYGLYPDDPESGDFNPDYDYSSLPDDENLLSDFDDDSDY